MFLDEIQQVILRLGRESIGFSKQRRFDQWRRPKAGEFMLSVGRHRGPHAFGLCLAFTFGIESTGALVSIDTMILQGMRGVERFFYSIDPIPFLTSADVVAGKYAVIENGIRMRPFLK